MQDHSAEAETRAKYLEYKCRKDENIAANLVLLEKIKSDTCYKELIEDMRKNKGKNKG